MINLRKTNSQDKDYLNLINFLDQDLASKDGSYHTFYAQFNKSDHINYVVVASKANKPIGCGAIKPYDTERIEIKRMYTLESERGKGVASNILQTLEEWAKELGYSSCILETGKKQEEAMALYTKSGYFRISNYGQYEGIENSLCFQKSL